MKNSMRRAMISTVCMLIVAVMSLTGVTYAWFTQATVASIDGLSMTVQAADGGLQIKTASSNWSNTLTFENNEMKGMKPCSTVNARDFFVATTDLTDPNKITTSAIEEGLTTSFVWTETLSMRNTGYSDITVNLGTTQFTDADKTDSKEAYLAARLAVFQVDSDGTEKLLFIYTAGDSEYKAVKEATNTPFNWLTGGDATATPPLAQAEATNCKISLPKVTLNDAGEEVFTIVNIKLVVWVEGQDPQCVNKNSNDGLGLEVEFVVDEQ